MLSTRQAGEPGRRLLELAWGDGQPPRRADLGAVRDRVVAELDRLPDDWRVPPYPDQPPQPTIGQDLRQVTEQVRRTVFA